MKNKIVAFVNTSTGPFLGLAFVISSQDEVLINQDIKTFYNIVSSIKIIK